MHALHAQASASGIADPMLVVGDAGPLPHGRQSRLTWEDGELDGTLVPATDPAASGTGVHQIAVLLWADGKMWLTHPSGPGRTPLPDGPLTPADRAEGQSVFGLFAPGEMATTQRDAPARAVFAALARAVAYFRYVVVEL
jgi:hypothetical protein